MRTCSGNDKPLVVIVNSPHPDWNYEKKELGMLARLKVARCMSYDELFSEARDADVLMVGDIAHIPLTREVLERLPKIKLISVYGVGVDAIDLKAATELGVIVANAPEYGVEDAADHTIALLLSLLRRVPMLDRELRKIGWHSLRDDIKVIKRRFGAIRRISSLTIGVIGFGRIGRAVARRLRSFGCTILGYDPYVPDEIFRELSVKKVGFWELLSHSDVITIHVTLTKETYHLLNEEAFKSMKDGTFIVNTSRGAVIDEKALINALKSGKISGAALDVFEEEPLPADSPLLKMENVILTPHIGWYSEEAMAEQKREAVLNVKAFLCGEKPPYIVTGEMENIVGKIDH